LKDKKAAKKIIRRAKKHPQWYSKEDVLYAKIVRKRIKREEKQHEREIGIGDSESRENDGVHSESQQPSKPRQSKGRWFIRLLYKARALVRL
jgi:hypothetical protein